MAVEHFTWPLVMPPVFWPVSGSLIVLLKVSTSSLYHWTQLLSVCPVLNSTFNSWAFPRFSDFHQLASLPALLPDSWASTSSGLLKCISSGLPFFQSLWFSSLFHHFLLSCFPCGAIQFHLLWVGKSTSRNKRLHGTVPLKTKLVMLLNISLSHFRDKLEGWPPSKSSLVCLYIGPQDLKTRTSIIYPSG